MKPAVERALPVLMGSPVGRRVGSTDGKAMLQTQRSRRWARAAIAAVGLTAATTIVASAGRAPLPRSTPVNAASARAPVAALSVLFVGAGVLALAALVTLSWAGRRRKARDEPELVPEPLPIHWIWKLLAILLPVGLGVALVAAALLGVKTVDHAPAPGGVEGEGGGLGRAPITPAVPKGPSSTFSLPSWVPWTVLVIVLVAIVFGGLLLARRRVSPADEPSERKAAREAVEAAIGALDASTDPRSAVIAAYGAMQRTLAAHGVARSRAEAPREYLRRVLEVMSGSDRDARTLTGLFEEARFSKHPIPEHVRELALSALSSMRARLRMGGAG